jgi:hypothetical protein
MGNSWLLLTNSSPGEGWENKQPKGIGMNITATIRLEKGKEHLRPRFETILDSAEWTILPSTSSLTIACEKDKAAFACGTQTNLEEMAQSEIMRLEKIYLGGHITQILSSTRPDIVISLAP